MRPPAAREQQRHVERPSARCRCSCRCRRGSASDRAASRRRPASCCSFSRNFANSSTWYVLILTSVRDLLRVVAVMRHRVMRLGDADLRVRPLADLARHHEREHARDVGLVRERQQVEHQLDVLVERLRHADRRVGHRDRRSSPASRPAGCAARSRGRCRGTRSSRARSRAPEPALQVASTSSLTESRMLLSAACAPTRCAARARPAEQPLEHHARVDLHRQRRRRRLPRDRVHVGAAVAARRSAPT